MQVVYVIFEWLLVLALLGFIAAIVWLVVSALNLKNTAMRDAKRLYQPPLQAVKNLMATGKGIVQQEGVRVKHIGGAAKEAAGAVRGTAGEVKVAATSVHFSDLKPALANVQTLLKVLSVATRFTHATAKQRPAQS